jgi:hypothetical protein
LNKLRRVLDEYRALARVAANVDNLSMELHPQLAGDLSITPDALRRYGFDYVLTDQEGKPVGIDSGTFLFASCIGALAH